MRGKWGIGARLGVFGVTAGAGVLVTWRGRERCRSCCGAGDGAGRGLWCSVLELVCSSVPWALGRGGFLR